MSTSKYRLSIVFLYILGLLSGIIIAESVFEIQKVKPTTWIVITISTIIVFSILWNNKKEEE